MKKILLILSFVIIALTVSAEITNKSGNVLKLKEAGGHVQIYVYTDASDSAEFITQFNTYIDGKLTLAKETAVWQEGKTLKEVELELLEAIIIQESKNGGILKYNPELDIKLIEDLK